MNKIRTLFRRGAAFLLAAALVAPGFGFPAVSAAQDGAVASYDPAVRSVTVNTKEARNVRESVDLASLPEEAQRALAGYTVVAVDEGGDSIQLVTAYRYGLLEGGMIACDYLLVIVNGSSGAVEIATVNGETVDAGRILPSLGAVAVEQDEAASEGEEEEPFEGDENGDSVTGPPAFEPESTPSAPGTGEEGGKADNEDLDLNGDKGLDMDGDAGTNGGTEIEPQNSDPNPNTGAESGGQEKDGNGEAAQSTPGVTGFQVGTNKGLASVQGTAPILSIEDQQDGGQEDQEEAAWTVHSGQAAGYGFTEKVPALEEGRAKLYHKDGTPFEEDETVDPLEVFGFDYTCSFVRGITLSSLADQTFTVDMKEFGQIFRLDELAGAENGEAPLLCKIQAEGKTCEFQIASVQVNTDSDAAILTMLSNEEMTANIKAEGVEMTTAEIHSVELRFSMTCEFKGDPGEDGRPSRINLGETTFVLDWSQVEAMAPLCKIEKTSNAFDPDTRVITWKIQLTPENDGTLAGATLTDTLSTDEAGFVSLQVGSQEPIQITGENSAQGANPAVDGRTLTYTFNSEEFEQNQPVTVFVKTRLKGGFFGSGGGASPWKITNSAAIENTVEGSCFDRAQSQAERSFNAAVLTKTGKVIGGSAGKEIQWSILVNLPFRAHHVTVYDLLPADFEHVYDMKAASPLASAEDVPIKVTRDSLAGLLAQYPMLPQEIQGEIENMANGESRELVVLSAESLPAGKHTISFLSGIADGNYGDKTSTNKAYITYQVEPGQGGQGPWNESGVGVTVNYARATVEKTASYDHTTRTYTWQINANNNKSRLENVTLTDDLTRPLSSGNNACEVRLNTLVWWTDEDGEKKPVTEFTGQLSQDGYPQEPQYTYDEKTRQLKIHVMKMSGETYHFSFDTIGVGKNYFESSASYQNITQKNGVALTSEMDGNTLSVRDETSITSGVALFAKRNAGALPNGESGSYDRMDNTIWWELHLNSDGRHIKDAVVTDTLPEGVAYGGEYLLYTGQRKSGDAALKPLTDVTEAYQDSLAVEPDEEGRTVTFRLGNLMEDGGDSARYILYIKGKVDPTMLPSDETTVSWTNQATLTGSDGGHGIQRTDKATIGMSNYTVTKAGQQLADKDNKMVYQARWIIEVNRNGKANGYGNPVLTDELAEGVTLTDVTIRQYEPGNWSATLLPDQEAEKLYMYENGVFQFTLPNISDVEGQYRYNAYQIALTAEIPAGLAGKHLKNTAKLTADDLEIGSSSEDFVVRYYGVSASASWDPSKPPAELKSLNVVKVSSQDSEAYLPGAVFEVFYTHEPDAESADWKTYEKNAVTDENGRLSINALPPNTTYVKLVEIRAPKNYLMPETAEAAIHIVAIKNQAEQITIENEPAPDPLGELTVIKRRSSATAGGDGNPVHSPLTGAQFTLTDGEGMYYSTGGQASDEMVTVTSGADGRLVWSGLPMGAYTLSETAAPRGYYLGEKLLDGSRKTKWTVTFTADEEDVVTLQIDGATLTAPEGLTVYNDRRPGSRPSRPEENPGDEPVDEIIPDGQIPEGPAPETPDGSLLEVPDEEIPLSAIPDEGVPGGEIPQESASQGERLPQTGGMTAGVLVPLGALLTGIGLWLGRRRKESADQRSSS